MVTIYQKAPSSSNRGLTLCLVGLLILCIAGSVWGFRRKKGPGEMDLASQGIVVPPNLDDEATQVIGAASFSHVEPEQRPHFVRQGRLVHSVYNSPQYMMTRRMPANLRQ